LKYARSKSEVTETGLRWWGYALGGYKVGTRYTRVGLGMCKIAEVCPR
jgi:hypothetical protein